MTLLTILVLVVVLALLLACFCYWVNHGGFLGFYMAWQVADGISSLFHLLISIIGECISNSSE